MSQDNLLQLANDAKEDLVKNEEIDVKKDIFTIVSLLVSVIGFILKYFDINLFGAQEVQEKIKSLNLLQRFLLKRRLKWHLYDHPDQNLYGLYKEYQDVALKASLKKVANAPLKVLEGAAKETM